MAITVASLEQSVIPNNGGHVLWIYGSFTLGAAHRIHIGETGTTADPECWSGKPGQGHNVYPIGAGMLVCYSPILPAYGPFDVLVTVPSTGDSDVLADAICTVPQDYKLMTFDLRQLFPPTYNAGLRRPEDAPAIKDWS